MATYKDERENVEAALSAAGLSGIVTVRHFEALKALNEFEHYDGVVQIGRPLPPASVVLGQARGLFAKAYDAKLDLAEAYERADVPLRLTGGGALRVQAWRHLQDD